MEVLLPEIDQRAEFVKALNKNPNDDLIRGMYADWLADRNDPYERAVRNPFNQKTQTNAKFICVVTDSRSGFAREAALEMAMRSPSGDAWPGMAFVVTIKAWRYTNMGPLRWVLHVVHLADAHRSGSFRDWERTLIVRAVAISQDTGITYHPDPPKYFTQCE